MKHKIKFALFNDKNDERTEFDIEIPIEDIDVPIEMLAEKLIKEGAISVTNFINAFSFYSKDIKNKEEFLTKIYDHINADGKYFLVEMFANLFKKNITESIIKNTLEDIYM